MSELTNERHFNASLSELIDRLGKLQKAHLEKIQVLEQLEEGHYREKSEKAALDVLYTDIWEQYRKFEEEN